LYTTIIWPLTYEDLKFDVSKFFEFRRFDQEKLKKLFAKKHRAEIARFNENNPRFVGLYDRHITNRLEHYFKDNFQKESLMYGIQNLRGAKHFVQRKKEVCRTHFQEYLLLMTPMEEWNYLIQEMADDQRFGFK